MAPKKKTKAEVKQWLVVFTEEQTQSTVVPAKTAAGAAALVRKVYKQSMGAALEMEFVKAKLVRVDGVERF
jgi:hypothetical protein